MQKRAPFIRRRFLFVPTLGIIAALLMGCSGYGGGWLPPDGVVYAGQGVVGFTFDCERKANTVNPNPPTGRLHIEMAYLEQGTNLLVGGRFGIHGVADVIDPLSLSQICIGQNPAVDGQTLTFLGRYWLTSSPPSGFPAACAGTKSAKGNCRFEVQVKDNDLNHTPSAGDWFSIQLSTQVCPTATVACLSQLTAPVFYTRQGVLAGGNIIVD